MTSRDQKEKVSHPLLGALIDNYQILEVIGTGGMGVVFKAHQQHVDRIVAIKLLPPELARDDISLKRFTREAQALAKLNHAAIVQTFDFGQTSHGQTYLALEFVDGINLKELLDEIGHLPVERALPIFVRLADAMAFAHSKGIIHRDLKPQNVMLTTDKEDPDQVKILDFGIAKLTQDNQKLTKTGEVIGSPIFMSPEHCKGQATDHRTDIYSLGILMFRCLTGEFPHVGKNLQETFTKKFSEPEPSFKQANPNVKVPDPLVKAVHRCLAIRPEERFQTMGELQAELTKIRKELLGQESTRQQPLLSGTPPEPSSEKAVTAEERAHRDTDNPVVFFQDGALPASPPAQQQNPDPVAGYSFGHQPGPGGLGQVPGQDSIPNRIYDPSQSPFGHEQERAIERSDGTSLPGGGIDPGYNDSLQASRRDSLRKIEQERDGQSKMTPVTWTLAVVLVIVLIVGWAIFERSTLGNSPAGSTTQSGDKQSEKEAVRFRYPDTEAEKDTETEQDSASKETGKDKPASPAKQSGTNETSEGSAALQENEKLAPASAEEIIRSRKRIPAGLQQK